MLKVGLFNNSESKKCTGHESLLYLLQKRPQSELVTEKIDMDLFLMNPFPFHPSWYWIMLETQYI